MEDCSGDFISVAGGGVDVNSAVQVLSVISECNNVVFHCQKVAHACELIMI